MVSVTGAPLPSADYCGSTATGGLPHTVPSLGSAGRGGLGPAPLPSHETQAKAPTIDNCVIKTVTYHPEYVLDLRLREEFLSERMPGTMIVLSSDDDQGMAQQDPDRILSITYPTADVIDALTAFRADRELRPVVLRGGRGSGKSHILAVLHHALANPSRVADWAKAWADRGVGALEGYETAPGYFPITEVMDNQEFGSLWDLLVSRHPEGQRFQGKYEALDLPHPPRSLVEEMLAAQPVALVLDEFQKWFEGLPDTPGEDGRKWRSEAFNFIKMLAEIAHDRRDLLALAVSFLDNDTEAYEQVNRVSTSIVDFSGPTAKEDRKRLLLHRLFENRDQIPTGDVEALTVTYADERLRVRFEGREAERESRAQEVTRSWPFSPELLDLLEEDVLMAQAAQESRDLIRILARIFRAKGDGVPLLTPAHFSVNDDAGGALTLLDSIQTNHYYKLREKALSDLERLQAVDGVDHAVELTSALWMRSMSPGKEGGASEEVLQLDLTGQTPVDPNAFAVELTKLEHNSVYVHRLSGGERRLVFRNEENPATRVKATASNDKFWEGTPGEGLVGQDVEHVRKTLRHVLTPSASQPTARVITLGPNWRTVPWGDLADEDQPDRWDRPVLLVLPESPGASAADVSRVLGPWLKDHVGRRRNTVRFLLPASGREGLFTDDDLVFQARCSYLVSTAWKDDPKYGALKTEMDAPFRSAFKGRYDRFAVLDEWDYPAPQQSVFTVEPVSGSGAEIPAAVERTLVTDLFDAHEFAQRVQAKAAQQATVGELFAELAEAPPTGTPAIPYLGEVVLYERLVDVAAQGLVALNVDGTWLGKRPEHSPEEARTYLQGRAFKALDRRQVTLGDPSMVSTGATSAPPNMPAPAPTAPVPPGNVIHDGGMGMTPLGTLPGDPLGTTPPGAAPSTPPTPVPSSGGAVTKRTDTPGNVMELTQQLELWGLPAQQVVDTVHLQLDGLTKEEVKAVLVRLPSSVRATLELTYRAPETP